MIPLSIQKRQNVVQYCVWRDVMKKAIIIILIMLAMLGMLFLGDEQHNKSTKFNITTAFYPIYIATLNITEGANNVKVTNLTKETTGCLHDYTLAPEELISLDDSDALIINGAGMEGFLNKVIENYPNLNVIDSSNGIELIKSNSGETEYNPHIFASVKRHIMQVNNISEKLIKLNPENAQVYEYNTEQYVNKLKQLQNNIKTSIEQFKTKEIITFHEAFTYFAEDFGLNVVATIEREPGTEPSAGELAETVEIIKDKNIKTIFVEPNYNTKIAETISNETGAKIYTLDPVASGIMNKDEYINIMERNIKVLKEALL